MSSVCMFPWTNCRIGALRPGTAVWAKLLSRLTVYSSGLNMTGIRSPVTEFVIMAFSRDGIALPSEPLALGDDAVIDRANHPIGQPRDVDVRDRGARRAAGARRVGGSGAALLGLPPRPLRGRAAVGCSLGFACRGRGGGLACCGGLQNHAGQGRPGGVLRDPAGTRGGRDGCEPGHRLSKEKTLDEAGKKSTTIAGMVHESL